MTRYWVRPFFSTSFGCSFSDISPLPFCHLTQPRRFEVISHFTLFYIYISRFLERALRCLVALSDFAIFICSTIVFHSDFSRRLPLHSIPHCFFFVIRYSFDIIHWSRRAEIVSEICFWKHTHTHTHPFYLSSVYIITVYISMRIGAFNQFRH